VLLEFGNVGVVQPVRVARELPREREGGPLGGLELRPVAVQRRDLVFR
jgi:hypothetical protein